MSTDDTSRKTPKLFPLQMCFVVESVSDAVTFCEDHYKWGPFQQFTIDVEDSQYKDWHGSKRTEVALGMAGKVQMEFLHVHSGRDTTADYQHKYGKGFQHIGISVRSRDEAIAFLEKLGASVNETREVPGVHFGFINTPTGEGMFELLETRDDVPANSDIAKSREQRAKQQAADTSAQTQAFTIDRATVVTADMASTLSFYGQAFRWENPTATDQTLCIDNQEATLRRYIGKAGFMELEIIEPLAESVNPYSEHLRRGSHGLIHSGGVQCGSKPEKATTEGHWKETGESFALYDHFGVKNSIQMRIDTKSNTD